VADDSHNHVWGNIDGASVGTAAGPRFTTASGYIEFGPANTTWAHIYTDRANFYFNKGANFQGNITLTGTVDGRDIAADGTKLDGIAVGATANVGDITGVTAGGGLTGGGTSGTVTISHTDTSSQASVNNSGSVYIQDITLDTYGHVTAIVSTTVPFPAPTSAQVATATAGIAVGAVGSYAWLGGNTNTTTTYFNPGTSFAGSLLRYAGTASTGKYSDNTAARIGYSTPADVAGTWRAMGGVGSINRYNTTLFLRIS
jgi:hypothetical protein